MSTWYTYPTKFGTKRIFTLTRLPHQGIPNNKNHKLGSRHNWGSLTSGTRENPEEPHRILRLRPNRLRFEIWILDESERSHVLRRRRYGRPLNHMFPFSEWRNHAVLSTPVPETPQGRRIGWWRLSFVRHANFTPCYALYITFCSSWNICLRSVTFELEWTREGNKSPLEMNLTLRVGKTREWEHIYTQEIQEGN